MMKPLLIASAGRSQSNTPMGRREGDVEVRRVLAFPTVSALDPSRPTVILLDRPMWQSIGDDVKRLEAVAELAAIVVQGEPDETDPPEGFPAELLSGFIPGGASPRSALSQLRGAFRQAAALVAARTARHEEQQRYRELTELSRVGVALATERNLMTLLDLILSQARRITTSDAGSLYLVERAEDGESPRSLRFKLSQNDSLPGVRFTEFAVPLDHTSLAGYAAATGEPLVIADVYLLPGDVEYRLNRTFDEKFGYRTKSMLVIPMRSHKDEVIGVLQLINRKRTSDARLTTPESFEREVVSYDQRAVELVSALAAQAGVSIENSLLYEDIEKLFEGFVTAAVTAIEARDPTTFGHSGRVATMTVGLAESVERAGQGRYKGIRFSREQLRELRYASLLHDFGKVGVREQVLVKQKKLYPADLEAIRHRFAYLRQVAELEYERRRAEFLLKCGRERYEEAVRQLGSVLRARHDELDRLLAAIVAANEPTMVEDPSMPTLDHLAHRTFVDFDGTERPLLTDNELRLLAIPRGTLDPAERREIESHVTHTYRFLQQIPWTRELRDIPKIAYGHHEKLNGTGYPRGVAETEIPVQTRIMTISDIYDALTASDRPYKRAVPSEHALDILHAEAKQGMLDRDLLETFVEARVFELVSSVRDEPGIR
jgi:HD-GYP domain-containing protein (c-di-GMP phosphodiesterase class II)